MADKKQNNILPFAVSEITQGRLTEPQSTFAENVGAGVTEGLRSTSIGLLSRLSRGRGGAPLSEEEFGQSFFAQAGVEYHPGITYNEAQAVVDAQIAEQEFNDIARRADLLGDVGRFGGTFAGAAIDPINLIPLGVGFNAARTLGQSALRAGAINAAIEATTFVPLEAAARSQEQLEFSTLDAATQVGFAFGLGGFFGAVGHSFGRMAERGRAFAVGRDIDADGNIRDLDVPPADLPADVPVIRPAAARKGATKTDAELVASIVDKNNPRPAQVFTEPDGSRTVIDPRTGEILHTEAKPTKDAITETVSESNAEIKTQIEKLFKRMTGTDAISRTNRDNELRRLLRARAEGTVGDVDLRPAADEAPDGVLVVRQSKGNETKVKEVSVERFFADAVRASRSGLGSAEGVGPAARANAAQILADRFERLTRQQFNFMVDHVANVALLRQTAKALGVKAPRGSTKREVSDLLFNKIHERALQPSRSSLIQAPRAADTGDVRGALDAGNQVLLEERLKRGNGAARRTDQHAAQDAEHGITELNTAEALDEFINGHTDGVELDRIKSEGGADVERVLRRAEKLKTKKEAIKEALLCLLE